MKYLMGFKMLEFWDKMIMEIYGFGRENGENLADIYI
jgi:hypothetical protein